MNNPIKRQTICFVFIIVSSYIHAQILSCAQPMINQTTMAIGIEVKNLTAYPVTLYMKRSGNPNGSEVLIHYCQEDGKIIYTDNWTFSNHNYLVMQPHEVKMFESGLIKSINNIRITTIVLDYWISYSDHKYQLQNSSLKKRIELPLSVQDKLLK